MRIEPVSALDGHVAVPGDKSISHRAVLIGALCDGETRVTGFGRSADTEATIDAMRALGAEVLDDDVDALTVRGVGLRGLRAAAAPIDCGNAGTLMRLIAGVLAGHDGRTELVGDASLSSRPMERIAGPLRRMGATIETTDGHAPLVVQGASLRAIDYELPIASAQVKSAILLAGVQADGATTVVEPVATRDHTERMLEAAGARVRRKAGEPAVWPAERLQPLSLSIPGDFSSAAPFVVAATLLPGSSIRIHGVGLNPTRTGLLDVLERMGARVAHFNRRSEGGEPVADLEVEHADLVATKIGPAEVPRLVDELPLFALVAGMARGESVVRGAAELRVKESDRIETVKSALRPLGIRIETAHDGFRVRGVPSRPKGGGMVETAGDHRIAMLAAVAGLVSREGVRIESADSVAVSFPDFFPMLDSLAAR